MIQQVHGLEVGAGLPGKENVVRGKRVVGRDRRHLGEAASGLLQSALRRYLAAPVPAESYFLDVQAEVLVALEEDGIVEQRERLCLRHTRTHQRSFAGRDGQHLQRHLGDQSQLPPAARQQP